MTKYLPVLGKDFTPDVNMRRKKYYVFHFEVASVLQREKKLLDSLLCRGVFRTQSNIYDGAFL